MSVLVDLKPEVKQDLLLEANAKGMSLGEYVAQILERFVPLRIPPRYKSAREQMQALFEWSETVFYYRTTPIPYEALTRESLYSEGE